MSEDPMVLFVLRHGKSKEITVLGWTNFKTFLKLYVSLWVRSFLNPQTKISDLFFSAIPHAVESFFSLATSLGKNLL